MQSVMQMFVARFASRNPCISRMFVLPKKLKGDAVLPPNACHFDRPTGVEKPLDAERDANVCGALCVKKPLHFAGACIT